MIKLQKHLKSVGLTHEQFADKIGISRQTIYNIIHKKNVPSFKTMLKIEKGTNGNVTVADLQIKL